MVRARAMSGTSCTMTTNSSPPGARQRRSGADRRGQPLGDDLQQPVAGGVAERVVDAP